MPGQREQAAEVLAFWFAETRPRQWFAKDPAFDALLRHRVLGLTRQAIAGELEAWWAEASTALALVLLLDQFPLGRSGATPIHRPWAASAMASWLRLHGSLGHWGPLLRR
jgi:uncharacterized protein (DUF924 family)